MSANVLTRIAGESIMDLFKLRIADPITMNPKGWYWGNFGVIDGLLVNGGSGSQSKGMHISAQELARFGLLFLNRGNWNGNQLISAEWVEILGWRKKKQDTPIQRLILLKNGLKKPTVKECQ